MCAANEDTENTIRSFGSLVISGSPTKCFDLTGALNHAAHCLYFRGNSGQG